MGAEGKCQSFCITVSHISMASRMFLLWALVSPSVQSGHHLTLPCSHGAHGEPLGGHPLPRLLSVAICHPISRQWHREGHVCPHTSTGVEHSQMITDVLACRWELRTQLGTVWLHLGTLPTTYLACPPVCRSPNNPCDLSALFATATSRPPASLWNM